jgi:hypothetical protein
MHAFLEGVLKYLLRLVIESIPENKKSQINILIGHMFGNIRNSEMNASTFLKSNFTHGYTNLTMLTADEWTGMTFALLIIIRSKCGQEIIKGGLHPAMASVITKEQRPVNDISPTAQYSHYQSISQSVEEENNDKQSNDDSDQDNNEEEDNNDANSVDPVVLPLWELTEILERLLVFHAFYKKGSPYDWIDQHAQESRIRLMGRQLMDMVARSGYATPEFPSDERSVPMEMGGRSKNYTSCFTWLVT